MPAAAEPFFDNDARIETLIYIPGSCWDEESQPDCFEDFCENLPEAADAPLYKQLLALARFADCDDEPEPAEVVAALFGVNGFFVQAATPCRTYLKDGSSFYSGWGNYWTEWLYAATEADIARVVVEWAEARHATDKAESDASRATVEA